MSWYLLDNAGRTIGAGDYFLHEHPAVVKERMRRFGSYLLHSAVKVVVDVGKLCNCGIM